MPKLAAATALALRGTGTGAGTGFGRNQAFSVFRTGSSTQPLVFRAYIWVVIQPSAFQCYPSCRSGMINTDNHWIFECFYENWLKLAKINFLQCLKPVPSVFSVLNQFNQCLNQCQCQSVTVCCFSALLTTLGPLSSRVPNFYSKTSRNLKKKG